MSPEPAAALCQALADDTAVWQQVVKVLDPVSTTGSLPTSGRGNDSDNGGRSETPASYLRSVAPSVGGWLESSGHQFAIGPDGQRLGASTAPHDLPVRLLGVGSLLLFVAWPNTQLQSQLVTDVQELVHTPMSLARAPAQTSLLAQTHSCL